MSASMRPLPDSYLTAAEFLGKSLVAQGGVTYELAGMDLQELVTQVRRLQAAMSKINAIRNEIIATQTATWSNGVYPMVAALDEAGYEYEGPWPPKPGTRMHNAVTEG